MIPYESTHEPQNLENLHNLDPDELEEGFQEILEEAREGRETTKDLRYSQRGQTRRTKSSFPGGRKITVFQEPLDPDSFLLIMQKHDIASINIQDLTMEYDPSRTTRDIVVAFIREHWGIEPHDLQDIQQVKF